MPNPLLNRFVSMHVKIILGRLVCFLLLGIALQGNAIVIRHDRSDSRYQVDEGQYPQLFFLDFRYENKVCVGTLIGKRWAITAGHCIEDTALGDSLKGKRPYALSIHGQSVRVKSVQMHPDFRSFDSEAHVDLALVEFESEVSHILPAEIYRRQDELDQVLSLVGWGFTGIGTRGLLSNDGKMRRAENQVFEADRWLKFRFDDPRTEAALDLEGIPGLGDSGGPALIESGGVFLVAGIAVGELQEVISEDSTGHSSSGQKGQYGAIEVYERVSNHYDWIDRTIEK